jgi:hypothetical protein
MARTPADLQSETLPSRHGDQLPGYSETQTLIADSPSASRGDSAGQRLQGLDDELIEF